MLAKKLFIFLLTTTYAINLLAQSSDPTKIDVLHYEVYIVPNLTQQTLKGNVLIKFKVPANTDKVVFDSGKLTVTRLEGNHTKGFKQTKNKVVISLASSDTTTYEIRLFYKGAPKRGLVFLNAPQQLYTVYFTSEWMICNAAPADRATLKLEVLVPNQFISIASGVLEDTIQRKDKMTLYAWCQDYETPAYTYGFAIGRFNEFQQQHQGIHLKYYAKQHTPAEIEQIFQYTADMLSFFEEKSGLPFPQSTYSQILMGNHYQEMSGFSILKQSYGKLILNDSTETNLIAHELAHQWWGNMITCKNWNHFWLNEGFATFLSAAYNEHRFGKEKYQQDIATYFGVFDKIRANGNDKPLVFKDWSNPTRADRNLVYFKGAYVLHLLKEELGDESFWMGIKYFSQQYYGKSVTTKDFQLAMETATNTVLADFFNTWIY